MKGMLGRFLLVLVCLVSLSYAEPLIKIEHITGGSLPTDVYLTIRNMGDEPIRGLAIYVNNELRKNQSLYLPPGRAIKTYLSLEFGTNLVNVTTPEGASDSIEIKLSEVLEETTTTTTLPSEKLPAEFDYTFPAILFSLAFAVAIVWFMIEKSRGKKRKKKQRSRV